MQVPVSGLFHWIGTDGGQREWSNPAEDSRAEVRQYLSYRGNIIMEVIIELIINGYVTVTGEATAAMEHVSYQGS